MAAGCGGVATFLSSSPRASASTSHQFFFCAVACAALTFSLVAATRAHSLATSALVSSPSRLIPATRAAAWPAVSAAASREGNGG